MSSLWEENNNNNQKQEIKKEKPMEKVIKGRAQKKRTDGSYRSTCFMLMLLNICWSIQRQTENWDKTHSQEARKLTNGGEGSNAGVRENWRDGAKRDAARVSLQKTADGGD